MDIKLGASSTNKATCPKCRAQSTFYVHSIIAEEEQISVCFGCGWRVHHHYDTKTTSRIKHKCQARLFLG